MLRRVVPVLLVGLVACGGSSGGGSAKKATTTTTTEGASAATMHLTSSAFTNGGAIPTQYTCDGANQSVPLAWTAVPPGTASVAVRMQDVDTPQKFIHWIVYDIPPTTTSLAPGQVPAGVKQTANSFNKQGYGGPCPPAGSKHRYVFTLLALSTTLNASEEVSPADLWATLERSAVIGKAELTGTYQRVGS